MVLQQSAWGVITKLRLGVLNNRNLFSQARDQKSQVKAQQGQFPVRAVFLASRLPPFHCVFTWWRKVRRRTGKSFSLCHQSYQIRVPPLIISFNYLLKTLTSNTVIYEFQYMNCGVTISVQSNGPRVKSLISILESFLVTVFTAFLRRHLTYPNLP